VTAHGTTFGGWGRETGYISEIVTNVLYLIKSLRLIHTCHTVSMPYRANSHMSCRAPAMSFVKVRVVAGNIRTACPTV
jgi:hypothetical protein